MALILEGITWGIAYACGLVAFFGTIAVLLFIIGRATGFVKERK